MSTISAIRLYVEPLRSLAFGSISGTYTGIGTGFLNPCRIYWLQNDTDVLLTFSWDGVTDHFVLPSGAFVLLDVTTNRTDIGRSLDIADGQRTYVMGSPTTGAVYLTSFYGLTGN
jgi:hypothetical protein